MLSLIRMKQHQIILGFSEIKLTLATKCGITSSLAELGLWFTEDHGILYVHDYSDHNKCMALAIYDHTNNSWRPLMNARSYSTDLFLHAIETKQNLSLSSNLNHLFTMFGYIKGSLR